jgi:uncharacterized protein YjiS (DUF1127 family)
MPAISSLAIAAAGPAGRALAAFGGRMARTLKAAAERMRNRRDAMRLAAFDDRMLADIGLTRCDLRDAYSAPLWHDPTDVLARRAAERRTNRPRSAVELYAAAGVAPPLGGAPRPFGYRPPYQTAQCPM